MEKIPVGVLGATGTVGQRLVSILSAHPWFELVFLGASERSRGRAYGEAVRWSLPEALPRSAASLPVGEVLPPQAGGPSASGEAPRLVFSALDAAVAMDAEEAWARAGVLVASNASAKRMRADVPLVVPELNPDHLALLASQGYPEGGGIVTNPNCSTIGLVLALKPLWDAFGIEACAVTTLQAASGAGYPGVPSLDLIDNAIPYIGGEEDKLEREPAKILGELVQDKREAGSSSPRVREAELAVSAACHRVAVRDGHLASVSVRLGKAAGAGDIMAAWQGFRGAVADLGLPASPERPLEYLDGPDRPQPVLDRMRGAGMTVSLGRLRPCAALGWKFELLSHNTLRGAAGGTVLLAELCAALGYVRGFKAIAPSAAPAH